VLAKHLGVEFLYERTDADKALGENEDLDSRLAALAALPEDQRRALHQAARAADAERLLEIINGLEAERPALAQALHSLVHNFRFDVIMNATQSVQQ
jgi:alkylation response protein AidB-like acyl-CoA dehydrogenase